MFQSGAEITVVIAKSTGYTLTNSTRLTRFATAVDVDDNIEVFTLLDEFKRLTKHHTKGRAIKIVLDRLFVDRDRAFARTKIYTGNRALATSRS